MLCFIVSDFRGFTSEDFHCAGLGHCCAVRPWRGRKPESQIWFPPIPPHVTHLLSYSFRLTPVMLTRSHSICYITLMTERELNILTPFQTHPTRSAFFWTLCTPCFLLPSPSSQAALLTFCTDSYYFKAPFAVVFQ